MPDVTLGKLIESPQLRDAIYVAVVPAKAAEMLRPCQRVGLKENGSVGPTENIVGIVDPYLTDVVPKGAKFWLCLLPGTVTGMRHHWEHPAFAEPIVVVPDKKESEDWLRAAANKLGVSYEDLMSEYSPIVTGHYYNNGEHIRDVWYELREEFWNHYEIVTGKKLASIN